MGLLPPLAKLRNTLETVALVAGVCLIALLALVGTSCEGEESRGTTARPGPTATPQATATPQPTATPQATATPQPTVTPAPTATPTPTPAPTATSTPSPTATPPEEGGGSRIGVTGDPIPELPDSVPGEQLTWRFPEPPHPAYPDRPFIVVAGEPIDSPEPWMHEHARALIAAHHRLMEVDRTSDQDANAGLLRRLMTPELVERRTRRLTSTAERGWRVEWPPYDSGVVAIEFHAEPEPGASARAYVWLHTRPERIRNAETNEYIGDVADSQPYTAHWLPAWRLLDDGTWQLFEHGGAPGNLVYRAERFVESTAPGLLPYYLLNANAREQIGLQSQDDLDPLWRGGE